MVALDMLLGVVAHNRTAVVDLTHRVQKLTQGKKKIPASDINFESAWDDKVTVPREAWPFDGICGLKQGSFAGQRLITKNRPLVVSVSVDASVI
mmetsp:Transcript_4003/g.7718  ORF Transcript_4003/g.7718 Transcript_4003/m.7718 type:complete len:94 (-) Transcript_4003:1153-1434(-)